MSPIEAKLHDALEKTASRDGFVEFVSVLLESFHEPGPPWINADLPSFLMAVGKVARELERFYDSPDEARQVVENPTWEAIGGILFSARCADNAIDKADAI